MKKSLSHYLIIVTTKRNDIFSNRKYLKKTKRNNSFH